MNRIADAFTTALKAFADAENLPVGWSNKSFIPPLAPHLRPVLKVEMPKQAELGEGSLTRYDGVFMVDVVVPAGEGEARAGDIASRLLQHFRRGQDLGLEGLTVKTGGSASAAITNGRYTLPVAIPYYAYLRQE